MSSHTGDPDLLRKRIAELEAALRVLLSEVDPRALDAERRKIVTKAMPKP